MFKNLFQKKNKLDTYRSMWNQGPIIFINDGWTGTTNGTTNGITATNQVNMQPPGDQTAQPAGRINKKPVEIWEELKATSVNFDFSNLDEKIKEVKNRIKVLEDNMRDIPKDEYEVLAFLEARRKYRQYEHLFKWPVTTDDVVGQLCRKYNVKLAKFEEYYTLIPDEGIREINKFRDACRKIRKENPTFRLIVPSSQAPEEEEKLKKKHRDPILIATSPFGRWDYILGAWDKEVAIVDDLIYNGK